MASLNRSERRPDDDCSPRARAGHRFLSSPRHQRNSGPLVSPRSRPTIFQQQQQQQHYQQQQGGSRTKRGLDVVNERDIDALKPKRARIAVEILAKSQRPPPIAAAGDAVRAGGGGRRGGVVHNQQHQQARLKVSEGVVGIETVVKPPPVPPPQHRKSTTGPATATAPVPPARAVVTKPPPQQQNRDVQLQPTKHQDKVRKGIQHELDRLQPQSADKAAKPSGRKLRSQEATRFKSELSAYFPDYDEVVGNDPKEQHLLNPDTPIVVVDSARDGASTSQMHEPELCLVHGYGDALFTDIFDAQRIDFSFLEFQFKNKAMEDPLPDATFEGVHKRAERLERSIRNTEKGRAQHEKDQIIRLLEGLQGPDWLRIMGISGITDSRKKSFEPAREHFIRGCQAIIDKFRNWTIEEKKKRKAEKERAIAEEAERAAGEDQDEGPDRKPDNQPSQASSVADGDNSSLAASSDVSSPAKQLREEALAASRASAKNLKRPRPTPKHPAPAVVAPPTPEPPKEFKSFFSKKYEREGALNKHRRAGRKVLAWGLPVPEMGERDFDLPIEMRDEETMRVRARKKRKEKRSSRV